MLNGEFNGFLRRLALVFCDIILFLTGSVFLSYCLASSATYKEVIFDPLHISITTSLFLLVNYFLQLYRSVWTFASTKEIISCTKSSIVNTLLLIAIDKILYQVILKKTALPLYDYLLVFFVLLVITTAPRIGYRALRYEARGNTFFRKRNRNRNVKRIMIVGAGYMGNTIIEEMINNQWEKMTPVVAVDDNPSKRGKKLCGVKIAGNCTEIPELVKKYSVDEIIITIPSASKIRINEISRIATSTGKVVKISASLDEIINDGTSPNTIRKVNIADLLSRDEVKLDKEVCSYLIGKTILVTGGGGSIGSELCKQCARYNPTTIVIFDIYENCAFELANELIEKYKDKINIQVRIGSVRDTNRLNEVFDEFKPDVVFHAAAHKHVPLMEDSPCEAVKNNVFGTYNVAVTADKFKVPKMVILSTDKAVNPTNVMGATKRITEIIVQYMNDVSKNTKYAAVRFGNVLGSHGSVIPIFEKQISNGGPVKVTHPEITRYFMTIPEAAQLVCQAGGLAKGGEIFVLDMGEPVKIMDLAENLIRLSGFTVEEIGIEIMGLRPGEKLYEELSMDSEMETRQKTANEKIYVNQPMVINDDQFARMLKSLNDINQDNVREKLMQIVPNYHPAKNEQ